MKSLLITFFAIVCLGNVASAAKYQADENHLPSAEEQTFDPEMDEQAESYYEAEVDGTTIDDSNGGYRENQEEATTPSDYTTGEDSSEGKKKVYRNGL